MMIKTLDNVYINMEDFSGFTIGYPNRVNGSQEPKV